MSLQHCKLTYDGTTKTLEAWGVEAATFQHAAGGGDAFSFTCKEALTAAPRFSALAPIALKDADGVQRFYGTIFPRRKGFEIEYVCRSGNFWLEKTPVRQASKFLSGESFTLADITRVRIGGERVLGDDLAAAVTACATQWGVPLSLNSTDVPAHKNPEEMRQDMKAVEVPRSICAWAPYLDYRYNYAGGVEMDFFSVLRTALGDLPANRHGRRTVTVGQIERSPEPVFEPMYEELLKRIKIYWLSFTPHVLDGGEGASVLAWSRDTDEAFASPANGSEAVMELTLQLRRATFNGTATDDDAELKVENLAQRLGAPYFQLWKAMGWTQKGEQCDWSIVPGELWDCAGADPLYEAAGSVCQVVTHDLRARTTRVQCGAPKQLGFYNPLLTNRLRRVASEADSGGQTYGFQRDNDDPDGTITTTIEVMQHLPDGPSPITLTLKGEVAALLDPVQFHAIQNTGAGVAHKLVTVPAKLENPA